MKKHFSKKINPLAETPFSSNADRTQLGKVVELSLNVRRFAEKE